jgi:DNA recombination protein RmuC
LYIFNCYTKRDLIRLVSNQTLESKANKDQLIQHIGIVKDEILYNTNNSLTQLQFSHKTQLEQLQQQIHSLEKLIEIKQDNLRTSIADSLFRIQGDNNEKLEKMRVTVEEKLQSTLESRLGESFKIISERLEQVHKGLGEMQVLASGVGDLKKVLSNVKTRGIWGELQVEKILEQILSPNQYEKNVAVNPKSNEKVEFAVKLPGKGDYDQVVWLPIDSKLPMDVYQKLITAYETADILHIEIHTKELEAEIKKQAKQISEKYICPPHTTDFAIMFLPIEGLYAELLRNLNLVEFLQREYRIIITSPTTFSAILTSLQMGFKTLAIEKRSSEVWKVLSTVKSEFARFAESLDKTKLKIEQVGKEIGKVQVRTRKMQKHLKNVEVLNPSENDNLTLEAPEELLEKII